MPPIESRGAARAMSLGAPRSIRTERLDLVPLTVDHARPMASALADPALYEFIGGAPPTTMELRELYATWVAGPRREGEAWRNWVVRLHAGGTFIGHVQATILDGGSLADIAWIIGTPWQGQGYATEAATALVGWLEAQGIGSVTAHVHPRHGASSRVAQRAGLAPTDEVEGGEVVWRRLAQPRPIRRDLTRAG